MSFQKSGICSHFHNISRLFDILPNSPFTTSETKHYYQQQTWFIRVAARVVERLKTQEILEKLENFKKISKFRRMVAQCPDPRQNEYSANTSKKLRAEIKLLPQCAISYGNQSQSQIFCELLQSNCIILELARVQTNSLLDKIGLSMVGI